MNTKTEISNPMIYSDPIWEVIQPRNGTWKAIEEMNAAMVCFHPALYEERRYNPQLWRESHTIIEGDVSIAELFRSILSQPQPTK